MHAMGKCLVIAMLSFLPSLLWAVEFPVPKVVKLSERVYVLLGPIQHANQANQGYMINSTVIIGDQGVVLIDPGGSDEIGRFIKQQVKKISSKPITHVINTHSHGDHYLGNVAFPEAIIISSEKCRDSVRQTGDEWVRLMEAMVGRPLPHTKPVAASVVYPSPSETTIRLNGVEMVVWVPPGSHTEGDLMILLPKEKILIAGDILVNGVVPTMQDGFIKNWIGVLKAIEQSGAEVFVPGHGAVMKPHQVSAQHDAIARFYADVKEGYRANLTEDQIRAKLNLTEWE